MITLQLLGGIALIIAAFGIRDFGRSWLFASKTDRLALEAELDLEDESAYAAATEAADKARADAAAAKIAAAGGVVEDDPPRERWNLLHLTNPWARRPAVVAVAGLLVIAGLVLAIVSVILIVKDALVGAWEGLCESTWVDARGWRWMVRLMWDGLVVGWRG